MDFVARFEEMKKKVNEAFTKQTPEAQEMARPHYEKVIENINENIEKFKKL